ncbi:MAG: efflux RND transporter periplasmic adaptor subunit [Bacteroidales bacterium]
MQHLKPLKTALILTGILLFTFSCQTEKRESEEQARQEQIGDKNPVDTMVLKKRTFNRELLSNGTLEALQKSGLRLKVSGVLQEIKVSNGEKVEKGQLIARLDDYSLKNELQKAQTQIEKARVNFQDVLIGQGYDPEDTASVPKSFLRIAKVKSGLADAQTDLKKARYRLESSSLYAPFTGVVANIEKKKFDNIDSGEEFCTLINNEWYHVKFSVLESELDEIETGKKILIRPLAGGEFEGIIDQINPVVDEDGLVTIRGKVRNTNGRLMEGMNTKVLAKTELQNKLVIPKSAMVLRQNKEVVFTVQNDSIATWNYIETGEENSRYYTVEDGLKPGDTVITSGNINLAHESTVEVQ